MGYVRTALPTLGTRWIASLTRLFMTCHLAHIDGNDRHLPAGRRHLLLLRLLAESRPPSCRDRSPMGWNALEPDTVRVQLRHVEDL